MKQLKFKANEVNLKTLFGDMDVFIEKAKVRIYNLGVLITVSDMKIRENEEDAYAIENKIKAVKEIQYLNGQIDAIREIRDFFVIRQHQTPDAAINAIKNMEDA